MRKLFFNPLLLLLPLLFVLASCGTLDSPDVPASEDYYFTSRPSNRISRKIFEVQAGNSIQFFANTGRLLDVNHREIEVSAWSIDQTEGASIDEEGRLSTEPTLPDGTTIVITGHSDEGFIQDEVLVYSIEENPLAGYWKQTKAGACNPSDLIGELQFLADRRFYVTWRAFESYVDYRGIYYFDLNQGNLTLSQLEQVNNLPDYLEPSTGSFVIDDQDHLILNDLMLGTHMKDGESFTDCSHYEFERN